MISFLRQFWLPLAIMTVALPMIVLISDQATADRITLSESYDDADLELNGEKLKGFALGTEGLLADWYWIRSLQYLGNKIVNSEDADLDLENLQSLKPRLLYPLLDNATDLDPKFVTAHSFGAIVLPAIDRQSAIKLTEKGIANNPDAWQLYHYLGYIHWKQKDYESAARAYEQGAAIAGSPPFMRQMVAAMKSKGGSRETARAIYSQILSDASEQQTRSAAEFRLMELDSLDERDSIRAALHAHKEKTSKCPSRFGDIFPVLRSVQLPSGKDFRIDAAGQLVDPSDAAYLLDPENCDVLIDRKRSKIPLN